MEINSREVLYKFFKKRNSVGHIFSNDMLFCDIEFKENGHERLLTEAEFDLNILLMGQFLFNYEDVGKHRHKRLLQGQSISAKRKKKLFLLKLKMKQT